MTCLFTNNVVDVMTTLKVSGTTAHLSLALDDSAEANALDGEPGRVRDPVDLDFSSIRLATREVSAFETDTSGFS